MIGHHLLMAFAEWRVKIKLISALTKRFLVERNDAHHFELNT